MAGTGAPRRDTSRTRSASQTQGCKVCGTGCTCCPNWCHKCNVRKCRVGKQSKFLDDALTTQYTRDYPPKNAFPERRVPGTGPLDSMPFYGGTTHKADYTPKKSRSQSARPAEKGIPANPLDDTTSYKTDFPPKRVDRDAPHKAVYPAWSAPFVGATTYNTEYIPRKVRPWTAEPPREPPSVPLEGKSEYKDSYIKKPIPAPPNRASQPLLPSSHVPTITTYGHDYVPLPFEKRERLHCCDDPRHPPEESPPCEWHGSSTHGASHGASHKTRTYGSRLGTALQRTR